MGRSRLQLTLAILKPDLMMHPVRTRVSKLFNRFVKYLILLFPGKIRTASELQIET